MLRPHKTPLRPDQGPLCEGLIIQVGTPGISGGQALEIAQRVVSETLRGAWEIQPLNLETRDFEVRPASGRPLSLARAWELTLQLRRHRDVSAAEPGLILPGIAPDPQQVFADPALRDAALGAFGAALDCAADCEWALSLCSIQDAWSLPLPDHGDGRRFGEGIVVGHPDTGYTQHPQIFDAARLLTTAGFDFEDGDANPLDRLVGLNPGHGTSTASVIMSAREAPGTASCVAGAAPSAQLVPLRVSTSVIHLSYTKLIKAIVFAADHGHHVISMSLGGPVASGALLRAIRYAVERGVILLGAAGNFWPWVVYPASYDEVIAVAACNCGRAIWSGSSAGAAVDVTAPGESTWVASVAGGQPPFRVEQSSGTSYAVAITAGICALWLAYHGRARLIQRYGAQNLAGVFKEILINSVDTPPNWRRDLHGAGIVNAAKVLGAPLPATAPAGGLNALHASPVPRAASDFDMLAELFPAQEPVALQQALAELLGTDTRRLDTVLAELGDELLFHLATDPQLRASIAVQASADGLAADAARGSLAENEQFMKNASPSLRKRIFPRR